MLYIIYIFVLLVYWPTQLHLKHKVEVALLSELEFKYQMTTARGGGREAGEGGMRALRCRGVQRTGSRMEGGEGEV